LEKTLNVIECSALIIIGGAIGRLIFNWQKTREQAIEEAAVEYEFHDERTSEARKERLLKRYPQYLISKPDSNYYRMAYKDRAASRMTSTERKSWVKDLAIVAGVWSIILIVLLMLAAVFVGKFSSSSGQTGMGRVLGFCAGLVFAHTFGCLSAVGGILYMSVLVKRLDNS
jgi:hypothetical protein